MVVKNRFNLSIPVTVTGVSDTPQAKTIHVVCTEDVDCPIGQAIASSLDGGTVDTDGSETISLVIGGLPVGTILKTTSQAELIYIANGEYSKTPQGWRNQLATFIYFHRLTVK